MEVLSLAFLIVAACCFVLACFGVDSRLQPAGLFFLTASLLVTKI